MKKVIWALVSAIILFVAAFLIYRYSGFSDTKSSAYAGKALGKGLVALGAAVSALIAVAVKTLKKKKEDLIEDIAQAVNSSNQQNSPLKEVELNSSDISEKQKFFMDDKTKKFGVYKNSSSGGERYTWNYSDLLNFNLFENDKQLLPNRETIGQNPTIYFGCDSMDGTSNLAPGTCSKVSIVFKINDVDNSCVCINFLELPSDISGSIYRSAMEKALEVKKFLMYIEKNKQAANLEKEKTRRDYMNDQLANL